MTRWGVVVLCVAACGACKRGEAPSTSRGNAIADTVAGTDADAVAAADAVADTDTVAVAGADADTAADAEATAAAEAVLALNPSVSTSIRNPNDGALEGGVALPTRAPGLRFNPKRDTAARFGTVEMVQGLVRAAAIVHEKFGGVPAFINDLSYAGGGPLSRHGSHQSGRDVDVLFYQLGPDGQPIEPVGAFFDPQGRGVDFRDLSDPNDDVPLRIDLKRTWRFVQALIEDESAGLQRVFVAEHLRTLLLKEGRRQGASPKTHQRFAEMTCQPGFPHDDHFHFRFFCSAEDIRAGCRDSDPVYRWRRRELADHGVRPKRLLKKRPSAKADITTHEAARAAAGPMDAEVQVWLDRREAWIKRPHTGRRYCK